jgi:hypothetical protein
MFKRKPRLDINSEEYKTRLNELLNDPMRQEKAEKQRQEFENMLNSPMKLYHKLPWWILMFLICWGIFSLFAWLF